MYMWLSENNAWHVQLGSNEYGSVDLSELT
jgi:hypothetical protein